MCRGLNIRGVCTPAQAVLEEGPGGGRPLLVSGSGGITLRNFFETETFVGAFLQKEESELLQ